MTVIEKSPNSVLCIDDKLEIISAVSRNLSYRLPEISCHGAVNLTKALKQIEQNSYHLILVDLRLSPHNLKEGLDFIAEIAPQFPNSKFVLYTSHPYDPVIAQEIERLSETQINFPLFVGDKVDVSLLSDIAETYFKQKPQIINTAILPGDLLNQLQEIKDTLWQKEVNRIYEYGELLNTARLAIEDRREQIKDELKTLESKKKGEGSPTYKQLSQELQEISKLWSEWLSEKIDLSYRQIANYVTYYRFFSQPEYYEYRIYVDLETFLLINKKRTRRQELFSDEEIKYLLERAKEKELDLNRMKEIAKVKKVSSSLPIEAIYRISAEPSKVIDYLTQALKSAGVVSVKQLEHLIRQSEQSQTKQMFQSMLDSQEETFDSSPMKWQTTKYYCSFEGTWQEAIAALPPNLEIESVIFEQKIADPQIILQLLEDNVQITTLKPKDWDNFSSVLEELIYRIGTRLVAPKIMIIQVSAEDLPKIERIIQVWDQAQTNPQVLPEDQTYFSEMLGKLSERPKLWLIGS